MSKMLDPVLLSCLVCPETHARLVQSGDWLYSTSREKPRRYPIRENIPALLVSECEEISAEQQAAVLKETQESSSNG